MIRTIKRRLPPEALIQIEAAEAEAAIKATDHFRRDFPVSSESGPKT